MRIGTANTYDNGVEQLLKRQSELAAHQERLSSGRRVTRASDDPIGIAQAERAMVHIKRIETDQRALEIQRNAIASAESTLGEAGSLMQSARDLVISAGNPVYSPDQRAVIARQIAGLRDQLLATANRSDSNGVPLFGSLGSVDAPFVDAPAGMQFQAVPGQRAATASALPGSMDGQAIWMNVPTGNGTFEVSLAGTNTGTAWTDAGTVVAPGALTGHNYSVTFSVVGGATTYDVVDTTTSATVATAQPYKAGTPIQFDGMSLVPRGVPSNGDTLSVVPSTITNIFQVVDAAIASIDNAPSGNKLSQAIALVLVQFDSGMDRLQAARSQAGEWLNRADGITSTHEAKTIALEGDRSRAEDLDMIKGFADSSKAQTGYEAALQSYAQIQRLSLFNYIS